MRAAACWIAVHLPALSIESFAATLGPQQALQPCALLEGSRIVAVDEQARQAGVQPGQRRATALAIEPTLVLGRADAARDRQAVWDVAVAALQFTPCVTEQGGHTVLMEVAASRRLFGGLERLVQRLCETLAPLRHRMRLACAPTAWGAALLASWEGWQLHDGAGGSEPPTGLTSQGATGASAPSGPWGHRDPASGAFTSFGIGPHSFSLPALRSALDGVPLALCVPDTQVLETLQGMGLERLGDLRALPRQGLARRFGTGLLQRLDQARGDAPDPRDWLSLPPRFETRLELFCRADTAEQVLHGADGLLQRLVHWAAARQARVSRFTLEMAHEARHRPDDGTPACSALPIELAQPSADAAHLRWLLRERLGRHPLPAPTLELRLRCDEWVHTAPPDGELFPTPARAQEGLARLLERLQARLGPQQVHGLVPVADHRPEQATSAQPARVPGSVRQAGGRRRAEDPGAQRPTAKSPHFTRPAWLLPEPRPLTEHRGRPMWDGQPLRLLAGPERIEAGWWTGPAAVRDYFVAGTPAGALVWIYRTRLPPSHGEAGWYLQGFFA